jgi:leucyl/phenylalanyl-tRNA--protein transferase
MSAGSALLQDTEAASCPRFHETLEERARRWALGTAYALRPNRVRGVVPLLGFTALRLATGNRAMPHASDALDLPDGLCGLVSDLETGTLLEGYRRGIFPFCHLGPLKWWSPRERMVLFFPDLHIAKRLRRQIRNGGYRVTFDTDFDRVIRACARPRTGKVPLTWITPRIMRAYTAAFDAGYAHSFEVWNDKDQLAGGGFGLAYGRMFSTESQFSTEPNTSKIGFTVLNWHLAMWGFTLNDGKYFTPTIDGMGFHTIPRDMFTGLCQAGGPVPLRFGRWSVETDLATVSTWNPADANGQAARRNAAA